MNSTRLAELEQLIEVHNQTRIHLELQKAQFGLLVPPHVEHGLREVYSQIERFKQELESIISDAIQIDLWTREGANPRTPGAQQLDWSSYFVPDPPVADVWNQQLIPQLRSLLKKCGEHPSRDLVVHARAHISAALAFGYTFPTTSPYDLWVEQKHNEWWRSKIDIQKSVPLEEIVIDAHLPELPEQANEISVEISIARDIRADVEDTIKQFGLPIGHRIQLSSDPIPGTIHNAGQAKAIAEQIRGAIITARSRSRWLPIHMFAAVPVGLAALIGAHLNACGPIQCYEHRRDQGHYVPACLLKG